MGTTNRARKILAVGLLTLLVGCGTGGFASGGTIIITGVTTPIEACLEEPIEITGANFLSEHGNRLIIRFTAVEGTPFLGGTSAVVDVVGIAVSNTRIELLSPETIAEVDATITVILPGGVSGTSTVGLAQIRGGTSGPPIARNDEYDTVGNVFIQVDVDDGLLSNDSPGGCVPDKGEDESDKQGGGSSSTRQLGLEVIDAPTTTSLGGELTVNTDGSFEYNPPVGIEGADSFTYTMTDGNDTDTATVQIVIEEMVWFIDDRAPPGGDGRLTWPINNLPDFNGIQGGMGDEFPGEGDHIFVFEGTGEPYDGGIWLLYQQLLFGEGHGLNVNNLQIVPPGNPPLITQSGIFQPGKPGHVVGESKAFPCILLSDENTIRGLTVDAPIGEGIFGEDVNGPTIVDDVLVRGTGGDGIVLQGELSGSFTFGTGTRIEDADGYAFNIWGWGEGFQGTLDFFGTISQSTGPALHLEEVRESATLTFANGTITANSPSFTWATFEIGFIEGTVVCTSPTVITGTPFIGIWVNQSSGTFTFDDVTINTNDDGLSASGIELVNNPGGTFNFNDANVTITGDSMAVPGGVPLRIGNLGQPSLTTGQTTGDQTFVNVTGSSTLSVNQGEQAAIIFGAPGEEIVLDVTFDSISVDGSPQAGGLQLGQVEGSFSVTGTTTITNFMGAGILVFGGSSNVDFSFNTLNITNGGGPVGRGIDLNDNTGSFTIAGGTIDSMTLDGVIVDDANLTMNNVACSNIAVDVVELRGTCTVGGTGNTATSFGNLGDTAGATVTGMITFDVGTVP